MKRLAGLALAAVLVGIGTQPIAAADDGPVANWRRVATSADRARLRNWRDSWLAALGAARAADGGAIAHDPLLFAPDRALPQAIPPGGSYRCRTIKLGSKGADAHGYIAYPWFDCRIEHDGDEVSFSKNGGAQRVFGHIYPEGAARAVFLGTVMLGDERKPLAYGRDATRNMAGLVERVGERRWRIALPEPRFESQLDVIEIVPAN